MDVPLRFFLFDLKIKDVINYVAYVSAIYIFFHLATRFAKICPHTKKNPKNFSLAKLHAGKKCKKFKFKFWDL